MQKATGIFADNQDATYERCDSCHGGEGHFFIRDFMRKVPDRLFIKYIHDDIIPPGSTFGDHAHNGDTQFEEWYLCLSGNGMMSVNDQEYPMGPGDISACYCNGSHGIKNTGAEDIRILVIAASPA